MEVDLSQLPNETRLKLDEVLRNDYNAKVAAAAERQRHVAMINYLCQPRARDGFGERTLAIDPMIDSVWRQYYGHDYSANPDLLKFLKRRNPEIGVKSLGTRVQIGWRAPERRFEKRYEWAKPENRVGIL